MISLALLLGLLGLVPAVSGALLMIGARALPRLVAAIWCALVLLLCLAVVLFFVHLLSYGDTLQATAFAPSGWAGGLQLGYQVDGFNIFSALVIGVLASAVAAVLIAIEPAQAGPQQQAEQQAEQEGRIGRQNRTWQTGMLLIALGAVFTAIFANSALWMVLGWGLAGLCAMILYSQGQTRKRASILLVTPCVAAIVLYLSLLPAISTLSDKRLDLLNGLGREPFWAALIMLAALLTPGVVVLVQLAVAAHAPPRPAGMAQSGVYALMASPVTFTIFARLALLIAGPGAVTPGAGSLGWRAFSLVIIWAGAILALAAALLAVRHAQRASLPLFLSIQLLDWMFAGIAITGTAALNGALLWKLLRFLALGALLLAGGRKPTQPILSMSWWLAALALTGLPFTAGFSSAWLITSGAIAAGPAWVAGMGVSWLALLVVTLAIVRAGGGEAPAGAGEPPPGATSRAEPIPSFLVLLMALLTLAVGIAPEVVVNFFTGPAVTPYPVIASSAPGAGIQTNQIGLLSATGAWLPGLFWLLAIALLLLIALALRHTRQPTSAPAFRGGEAEADSAGDTLPSPTPRAEPEREADEVS